MVVVAICSLLIAMLLPGLQKARETVEMVHCQSNVRQQGVAMLAYSKGDLKNARRYFETASYIDRTWLEYSVIDTWRRAADTQG